MTTDTLIQWPKPAEKTFSITADRMLLDAAMHDVTGRGYEAALEKVGYLWWTDNDLYYEYVRETFSDAFGVPVKEIEMWEGDDYQRYQLDFLTFGAATAFAERHLLTHGEFTEKAMLNFRGW